MELWLSQHPTTNTFRNPKTNLPPFNPKFITQFHTRALLELQNKYPGTNLNPPSTTLKAVCLGFFMTANEVWEDLFQTEQNQKPVPLSNSILKGVTSTIQETFRPLMVISEKISSVFGRKKRKYNE
jgi:hypothetical protein